MKTLRIPAKDSHYEVVIEYDFPDFIIGMATYTGYNISYCKCWPCEDGVYEPPDDQVYAVGRNYLLDYLRKYVSWYALEKVYCVLGI